MKNKILMLILLLTISPSVAQDSDWIKQVIDLTINTRFVQAESLLTDRLEQDSSYQNWFYYATVLSSKMTHFENFADEESFLLAISKVLALTNDYLEDADPEDCIHLAQRYFYRGSAYGYLAYYEGQKGKWYPALKDGMRSVDDLENALNCDSTMWDAYLGLGVYQYWKSTKLKFVTWLPFVPDRREEGIANIKKAIENECHSRYLAMHQLVYILTDFEAYDEALYYAKQAVTAYPASQFMWWAYAHCFYKMHKNEQAVTAYQHLLRLIEEDDQANPMHWVSLQLKLADIYDRSQDREKVLYHCRLALDKPCPGAPPEAVKKNLEKARELIQRYRESG